MEARAAAAAAYVLGGHAIPRDIGGARIRDFDLLLPGGAIEPLEITLAADEVTRRTWARIDQLDRAARTLTRAWTLAVPTRVIDAAGSVSAFAARDFLASAEPLLHELEQAGITEFDTARWLSAAHPAVASLVSLGCDLGMSGELALGEVGRIYLSSSSGGWVAPDAVAAAVEAEANKPDNIQKLQASADASRRHLFVVIDGSSSGAFPAASHGSLGRTPVLPDPITTSWVGASENLHVTTPPGDWETHEIPEEVFADPERWILNPES